MRPCDCVTVGDVRGLDTVGVFHNKEGIQINDGCSVTITIGACALTINKLRFRQMVDWYFEDQEKEEG